MPPFLSVNDRIIRRPSFPSERQQQARSGQPSSREQVRREVGSGGVSMEIERRHPTRVQGQYPWRSRLSLMTPAGVKARCNKGSTRYSPVARDLLDDSSLSAPRKQPRRLRGSIWSRQGYLAWRVRRDAMAQAGQEGPGAPADDSYRGGSAIDPTHGVCPLIHLCS